MDKDKEFLDWLKLQDFFTAFVKSNPNLTCWITCRYIVGRGYDVRVWYNPREIKERNPNWSIEQAYSWMYGYGDHGDHGVAACEIMGISSYAKYINQEQEPIEGQDKTWEEVYTEWKADIRDKKLSNIIEK